MGAISVYENEMLEVPLILTTNLLDIEVVVEITGQSGSASKSNHAHSEYDHFEDQVLPFFSCSIGYGL